MPLARNPITQCLLTRSYVKQSLQLSSSVYIISTSIRVNAVRNSVARNKSVHRGEESVYKSDTVFKFSAFTDIHTNTV